MKIDLSLGDPILPFKTVINRAFSDARKTAHQYEFPNQFLAPWENEFAHKVLNTIREYFTAKGIYEAGDWSGLNHDQIYLTSGGTTGAYELIIRRLAEQVEKLKISTGQNFKPVILMPVPTYGYFFDQPEKYGIEVVKIPRDLKRDGFLDPPLVLKTIQKLHKQGKRVVAYYDCTPHNPMGFVRSREETETFAKIFRDLSENYREKDQKAALKMHKGESSYYHGRSASRVRVIDDLVYDGLTYDGSPVFSYAQVPEFFKNTFVLAGISKNGFVNGRAGIVIGDEEDIRSIHNVQKTTSYLPPMAGVWGLHHFFNDAAMQKAEREAYQIKVREIYRFNGLLMKALINGLPNMEPVDEKDQKHMENLLMRHQHISRQEASSRLRQGMPHVKVITSPKSGFFHLIDFSALKGMCYDFSYTRRDYPGSPAIVKDERTLHDVISRFGLKFAAGSWCGLPTEDMIMRATFAMTPQKIIEACDILKQAMQVYQPAPSSKPTQELIPA
jgi:aspartate/methionine/tyrosine aminotransferase